MSGRHVVILGRGATLGRPLALLLSQKRPTANAAVTVVHTGVPEELGGRGLDYIRWLIFEEEYFRAGAPNRANQNGIFLLGPTIMEFGTEEEKEALRKQIETEQDSLFK